MTSMNKQRVVGGAVLVLLYALTWRATNFLLALLLWLGFVAAGLLVLFFLKRDARPANGGAGQWNELFLRLLPKHLRAGVDELKKREKKST